MTAPYRVLLVDDDLALMGTLRRIVERARPDALVVYTSDVASAVWQIESTALRFVVTDLNMQKITDAGWRVVAAARDAAVMVAILTGSEDPALVERARIEKVPLLRKGPNTLRMLESMVHAAFGGTPPDGLSAVNPPPTQGDR